MIVGFVEFATKLYHTSFLLVPQAPAMAVYVAVPGNDAFVVKQPGAEGSKGARVQLSLCVRPHSGNKASSDNKRINSLFATPGKAGVFKGWFMGGY